MDRKTDRQKDKYLLGYIEDRHVDGQNEKYWLPINSEHRKGSLNGQMKDRQLYRQISAIY